MTAPTAPAATSVAETAVQFAALLDLPYPAAGAIYIYYDAANAPASPGYTLASLQALLKGTNVCHIVVKKDTNIYTTPGIINVPATLVLADFTAQAVGPLLVSNQLWYQVTYGTYATNYFRYEDVQVLVR